MIKLCQALHISKLHRAGDLDRKEKSVCSVPVGLPDAAEAENVIVKWAPNNLSSECCTKMSTTSFVKTAADAEHDSSSHLRQKLSCAERNKSARKGRADFSARIRMRGLTDALPAVERTHPLPPDVVDIQVGIGRVRPPSGQTARATCGTNFPTSAPIEHKMKHRQRSVSMSLESDTPSHHPAVRSFSTPARLGRSPLGLKAQDSSALLHKSIEKEYADECSVAYSPRLTPSRSPNLNLPQTRVKMAYFNMRLYSSSLDEIQEKPDLAAKVQHSGPRRSSLRFSDDTAKKNSVSRAKSMPQEDSGESYHLKNAFDDAKSQRPLAWQTRRVSFDASDTVINTYGREYDRAPRSNSNPREGDEKMRLYFDLMQFKLTEMSVHNDSVSNVNFHLKGVTGIQRTLIMQVLNCIMYSAVDERNPDTLAQSLGHLSL